MKIEIGFQDYFFFFSAEEWSWDHFFWTSNKMYSCSLIQIHWILNGLYETWRKMYNFPITVLICILTVKARALLLSGQVTFESSNLAVQFAFLLFIHTASPLTWPNLFGHSDTMPGSFVTRTESSQLLSYLPM